MRHRFRQGPLQLLIPSASPIRLWMTLSIMFRLPRCTHTLHMGFIPSRRIVTTGAASSFLRSLGRLNNVVPVQTRLFAASSYLKDGTEDIDTKETRKDATEQNTPVHNVILIKFQSTTVSGIISESIELLEGHYIPEPTESAVNLLAAALDLPWETGHRDLRQLAGAALSSSSSLSELHLTAVQLQDYTFKIQRRLQHEPIQYILGQWDFLDYTLCIERPLLCPRPETEELVGLVLSDMKNFFAGQATTSPVVRRRRVLDIGCGTGCIGIALAAADADANSNYRVTAIDVEPVAVKVAAENAALILGPSWRDRYSVLLESAADFNVRNSDDDDDHRFHVVVSNPPYIPATDKASLTADVVNYESATALFGGHDGMDVIRTIVRRLPEWCVVGAICWMEVDPTHPALLRQWLTSGDEGATRGVEYVTDCQDLSGRDRFVKLRVVETR